MGNVPISHQILVPLSVCNPIFSPAILISYPSYPSLFSLLTHIRIDIHTQRPTPPKHLLLCSLFYLCPSLLYSLTPFPSHSLCLCVSKCGCPSTAMSCSLCVNTIHVSHHRDDLNVWLLRIVPKEKIRAADYTRFLYLQWTMILTPFCSFVQLHRIEAAIFFCYDM